MKLSKRQKQGIELRKTHYNLGRDRKIIIINIPHSFRMGLSITLSS